MIRDFFKAVTTSGKKTSFIALATVACALNTPNALAAKKINSCNKWNNVTTLSWISTNTNANAVRDAAYTLLDAGSHGLDPADYMASKLADQARVLLGTDAVRLTGALRKQVSKFNRDMTRSVACYLQNVKSGRLNPHAIHKQIWLPRQNMKVAAELTAAFEADQLIDLFEAAAPQTSEYRQLRQALTQVRAMSLLENGARLPGNLKTTLELGQSHSSVAALRARLIFLGDLKQTEIRAQAGFEAITETAAGHTYDVALMQAVANFQKRHGLETDGVIGRKTRHALAVSMPARAAQIELAMERVRWYPKADGKRVVRVNIPQFSMLASAPGEDGTMQTLTSKVIVGKPGRSHTPLFAGPITRIEFSPMWFVPRSYAKKKLLPRLRRDPGYMKRANMEFRLANGKTTQRVNRSTLRKLARGQAGLQQRSGPSNALGRVKFILPNSRAIFMHDTNNRKLFAKNHRALSLGCVRIEKPLQLANMLLADQPKWNSDAIDAAATSGLTKIARTTDDTIVMLSYMTAVATDTGELNFFSDLYGMDKPAMKIVDRWANPKASQPIDPSLLAQFVSAKPAA